MDLKLQLRDRVGEVKVSAGVRKQHQTAKKYWIIFSLVRDQAKEQMSEKQEGLQAGKDYYWNSTSKKKT